ncbi:MAG: hypothetical protein ACT4OV_10295 [Microthrixaceae bacterium]
MMFDNTPPPPSRLRQVVQHVPLALLAVGAVGTAASVHLASVVVATVAVGHLGLGLVLLGIRAAWQRRTRTTSS